MDALLSISDLWQSRLLWIAGLTVPFAVLSYFMACNPGMYWWKDRRALVTDLHYWLIMPMFIIVGRMLMLFAAASLLFAPEDKDALASFMQYGYGLLAELPIWVQAILILVFADFLMYWIHRGFHTVAMWRYHAIHHSPKTLDWMSTQRFHIVNTLLEFTLVDIIMLMLGFSPLAIAALGPFNVIYSAMVHANLKWTFGPFRYVLASPVFHRWHHTSVKQGGMKNFAPTFPILDVIFGTFYMPKDKLPADYGVHDPDFPEGFWAQFAYPFRKKGR